MKTKLCIFDFDGTLVNTPIDTKENRMKWANHYGVEKWPYIGWWGRDESLDTDVWDMPIVGKVFRDYQMEKNDPNNLMVMLTGRMYTQAPLVKKILDDRGYSFNHYLYKRGGNTLHDKIKQILIILDKHPNIRTIEMWDDRPAHFEEFEELGSKLKDIGRIDSFYLNRIDSDQWDGVE